jgi:hypothetical protein
MTTLERSVLNEMLYWIEQLDREMMCGAGAGLQEVDGEMRKCCVMCGHCPSALADRLRKLLGTSTFYRTGTTEVAGGTTPDPTYWPPADTPIQNKEGKPHGTLEDTPKDMFPSKATQIEDASARDVERGV